MHPILEHHEIEEDLRHRCALLARHYSRIFGGNAEDGLTMAYETAKGMAGAMGQPGGLAAAQRILEHLVPEVEKRGTGFWGTPLGRACGWWTGGGQLEVDADAPGGVDVVTPQPRVSLLLGMTRQSAFELVSRGRLKKVSAVGVRPEDVRREMQARYPL